MSDSPVKTAVKVYALADIHGKADRILRAKAVIQNHHPDLVVIAGDITQYVSAAGTVARLADISVPIFAIRGNSDFKTVETRLNRLPGTKILTPLPIRFQGRDFIGFNGTIPLPFLSKICLAEKQRLASALVDNAANTMVVAHPPPRGLCDRVGQTFSAGSIQLKRWVDEIQPALVICGHIHEQAGLVRHRNTLVVNCAMSQTSDGAIIEWDRSGQIHVQMIPTHH